MRVAMISFFVADPILVLFSSHLARVCVIRYLALYMRSSSLLLVVCVLVACMTGSLAVTCGPCDATACEQTTCGPNTPYYCDAGYAKGGCAAHQDAWDNTKVCFSCCNVNECKPRFSCTGTCPRSVCESAKRCPLSSNFQCTSGSFNNGCSANASYWPFQHNCGSCCDVTTCEFTCGTCTAAQCAAGSCTAADRFQCTAGPMANNCTGDATYFGTQSQCFSCCDTSTCAAPYSCNKKCSAAFCQNTQRCPVTKQYMCTAGSATLGCSTNASYWPFDHQCSDCCDVTQCEFSCPPCTLKQCSGTLCTPVYPYMCTGGALAGQCNPSPTFFGEQSQCSSCCDTTACPSDSSSGTGVRLH